MSMTGTPWEVEYTDEFAEWWITLTEKQQDAIAAAVEVLEERGPGLGRQLVDTIHGSRHANMKELRPPGGSIRIFFAFDPVSCAILLIGGDKTNHWKKFYDELIPLADRLYDEHLHTLEREGKR